MIAVDMPLRCCSCHFDELEVLTLHASGHQRVLLPSSTTRHPGQLLLPEETTT